MLVDRKLKVGDEIRRSDDNRTFRVRVVNYKPLNKNPLFSAEPTDGEQMWWGGLISNAEYIGFEYLN